MNRRNSQSCTGYIGLKYRNVSKKTLLIVIAVLTIAVITLSTLLYFCKKSCPQPTILYDAKNTQTIQSIMRTTTHEPTTLGTTITITSIFDLIKQMNTSKNIKTINVTKLVDRDPNSNSEENENTRNLYYTLEKVDIPACPESVNHIIIKGPITTFWLQRLLDRCDKIQRLTIDVGEVCRTRQTDWDAMKPIKLRRLTRLEIDNSYFCTMTSWIFKWELRNILELEIRDSDFFKPTFDSLQDFINKSNSSLESLVLLRTFKCVDCILSLDINYLKSFKNVDERKHPFE